MREQRSATVVFRDVEDEVVEVVVLDVDIIVSE